MPSVAPDPGQDLDRADLRCRLLNAMAGLPGPMAEAVNLHYLGGLSLVEIARLQGVAAGTVRLRVWRGLRRLRHLIGDRRLSALALLTIFSGLRADIACPHPAPFVTAPLSTGTLTMTVTASFIFIAGVIGTVASGAIAADRSMDVDGTAQADPPAAMNPPRSVPDDPVPITHRDSPRTVAVLPDGTRHVLTRAADGSWTNADGSLTISRNEEGTIQGMMQPKGVTIVDSRGTTVIERDGRKIVVVTMADGRILEFPFTPGALGQVMVGSRDISADLVAGALSHENLRAALQELFDPTIVQRMVATGTQVAWDGTMPAGLPIGAVGKLTAARIAGHRVQRVDGGAEHGQLVLFHWLEHHRDPSSGGLMVSIRTLFWDGIQAEERSLPLAPG